MGFARSPGKARDGAPSDEGETTGRPASAPPPRGRASRPSRSRPSPARPSAASTSRRRRRRWQLEIVRRLREIDAAGRAEAQSGSGAASEASSFAPPTASAGNSFSARKPSSRSAIASDAVAQPGRNGTGAAAAASASAGVAPGLTRKRAPAATASSICAGRRDRAGADDGARNLLGDRRDGGERARRAQGDLDRVEAAGDQRLRLAEAVLDARAPSAPE